MGGRHKIACEPDCQSRIIDKVMPWSLTLRAIENHLQEGASPRSGRIALSGRKILRYV
jgi:hypothetical protein